MDSDLFFYFYLILFFFYRNNSVETSRYLNVLVALEYLSTWRGKDQRESLQGKHVTQEQKEEFKHETL